MKVILMEDVKSLGKRGELVEASDGYARNYLLPRKLAKEANAQAMNEYKNAENSKNYKIATQKAQAEAAKKQLEGKVFKMTARAGQGGKLFGSITSKQVAEIFLLAVMVLMTSTISLRSPLDIRPLKSSLRAFLPISTFR